MAIVLTLTAAEAAAALNGNEYGSEGSRSLFTAMKAAGLVAVFGASDDLAEFRGAIDDEDGAYEGGTIFLTRAGLLRSECHNEDCPYFKKVEEAAPFVEALWNQDGFSFRYKLTRPDGSPIPHEKFVIMEDGQPYCEGIVFSLDDLPA